MAAADALESLNAIKRNNGPVDLLVQHLVDCDTRNGGCRGGFVFKAFDYIINNGDMEFKTASRYTEEGRTHARPPPNPPSWSWSGSTG
jgi:cathepsin L